MGYRDNLGGGSSYKLNAIAIPNADYVSVAQTDATTETYTFKLGGASGATVATLVIVYTAADRELLSTVTLT
jgi:hypothetical protein